MPRSLRIPIYIAAVALLVAFGLWFYFRATGPAHPSAPYPDQTVRLSNSALLRIHSSLPFGSSDMQWQLSYRDKSDWEKVDDWMVEGQMSWYGGDILACPVDQLVVVARTDGSLVFVRSAIGRWHTLHMEIPERAPFPIANGSGTNSTSLETSEILKLRSQMSAGSALGRIPPHLAQFSPDTRDLWVDYLNRDDRRFRFHFTLSADGEKLQFVDMEERPFTRATDTDGPPFFLFRHDKQVSAACNTIEPLQSVQRLQ
jgi:hypothetical protein